MPSSCSSEGTPTNASPRASRGTPRAGPHSPNCRRTVRAPAGNKQRKQATDVQYILHAVRGRGAFLLLILHVSIIPPFIFFL